MNIPRPTDADRERFRALVPHEPNVEVKPMFGNLGAFVNGNMFMGLFGSSIGLRLPEEEQAKLRAQPGAGPFGPEERPMGGYTSLPAGWTAEKTRPWVTKAVTHVGAMPAKTAKAAKKKK